MATDSLGEYKVVVTADYSQLKSQFDAINSIIKSTSESITNSLSAASNTASSAMINSFGNVSKSIVSAMKSAQESLNGFNSVAKNASTSVEKLNSSTGATSEKLTRTGNAARSGSEGFRDYARRVREAEKAEDDFYKQQGKSILAAEERAIAGRTAAHKSAMEEIFRQEDAIARKKQTEHNKQQQRIRNLQTQYNVTYGEINKYMQAHAKMSEAVFIRLQGKISAIADEMRKLGAMPVKANPLAGMDYNKYTSQFSKWNDFFASFKHHMTWMASAMAIGTAFAIPAKTISTIAEVERQMAQMKQVNHDVNESQLVLNNTTQAFIGIAQRYGQSVDDVIKAGVLWGRQYKDLNEVMKLTNLSAKLAVADNMDVGLANRAVESVINGYQRQGDAVNFANHVVDSWTKIAHNAQSSATDLAEALMRTGAAAKAVGVDFDTTNALASAMIKSTGRSGAEVGNALKSLFSSIHNDKAIKQLEALGIQMYQVDADGQKHFRNLHDVFIDLMITSHTTSKNMEKDLLAISGGKFQWSKVASVLGSYKDFLHAYTMSLDSTNFSQGQIAAQLDTIDRKFQQLKATVTGIATGMGASGLSAYIKNILTSLNSFAKALQRIPTWGWKIVGGFVAVSAAVGAALLVVKLFAGGIAAITGAMAAYTVAAAAGTVATEGMAAAVTAATGGLNILLALVISAAAAFLGYNAVVGSLSEATDQETQSLEDNIQVKRQQIEMSEKQGEMIETLCNSHVKLQEALNTTQEGTEQHKRAEEDLAATDQALTEIIGEDAMRQIDWNGDLQGSINSLKNAHSEKTRQLRMELAQSLDAQASYQEAESARIEATITNLETEGTAWTTLGHIIESVLHGIGTAMVTLGEGIQSAGGAIKELFPSAGESLQSLGSSVMLSGINHQNFHSEWSDDRADNASKIAELKGKLTQSKLSAARARTEADAIRSTGGSSNPYAVSGAGGSDSGIVPDEEAGSGTGAGAGKGKGSGAGAGRQADNSVEAMGYRYLKGKGIDANFALGLLANAAHESSFNPDATNGNHWGMFQWDATRWGGFINDYLSQRNMSQSEYYNSDVDTKRALQYDYALYELKQGNESGSYQEILSKAPSTPEQWAHLLNMYWERSGVYSGGTDWERQKTSREYMERFGRNGGEANYTDVLKEMQKTYQTAKAQFDADVAKLKYERELKGERVTPAEIKAMYEKSMGVKDGKSAFDAITNYQKDYMKVNLDYAKEIQKAQQYVEKATQTQVSAIEKMADAEVAFSEKIGLMSKQDVWNYNYRKNESNYSSGKAKFDAQLVGTVDTSKGTADDMLSALQGLIDAQNQAEAKLYADRIMWLSKDIEATKKALDERIKLEEKYQQERYKLEQEEFLRKNKYVYGFVDSFVDAWSSGMESILNRTKSFGEALRDMFKQITNAIIKMFVEDWATRLKNILSKTIHQVSGTGYGLGTNHDRGASTGQMATQYTGAALGSWASSSLSSLSFGNGKTKGATSGANSAGMFTEYLIPTNAVATATKRINQVTRVAATGANAVATATQTASTAATATVTANEATQTAAHTQSETTQTGVTVANAETRTAVTNQAHANVMANIGAMITQMLAAIAIMAVFSALFGGGGSSTSESTSSVNLGRSPDSYYMTPTPVMQSTTFTVPSMDIGGNIEKDMLIYAHKNEMVLTPEQADVIRSTAKNNGSLGGNGGASATVRSNINVSTVDSRGFDRVLRDYNRDLSKNVKKGIRNGYLNTSGLV